METGCIDPQTQQCHAMASSKKKKQVSVTNIPAMQPPPLITTQLLQVAAPDAIRSRHELSGVHSSSSFLDPTDRAILQASESKVRRKKEETRVELEKIQERIHYTLSEYQPEPSAALEDNAKEVDLHAIESPEELYRLLADVRLRTKYQQQVAMLLLGHETALEDRERLLQSIHEFFQETQAGNTTQLLEELAAEEIDFAQATAQLESALRTAQSAGERLLEIQRDMGQLFAIVQAFPDTKKGRKKLEKALLKAQEEVELTQNQLQAVQGELEGSKEKTNRLQKQVDVKTTECERLRKTATQVEQLQRTNAGLQAEMARAKEDLQRVKVELERERQERLTLQAKKEEVKQVVLEVEKDNGRVKELEAALEAEKTVVGQLETKMEAREDEFREEKEALVAEHEAEIQEMRGRYEEQMKSLMEDDMFSNVGSAANMEGDGEEVDFEPLTEEQSAGGLSSQSAVEHLKHEHQQRDVKLKEEMADIKNKSRKTITGLKVQLTEAQNRLTDETSSLQKQIDSLEGEKISLSAENHERSEHIASLEETKVSLEVELAEMARREAETRQLHSELEEALAAKLQEEVGIAQGSLPSMSSATEHHYHPTSPPPPILPMDEVQYTSATQLTFAGGDTPQSVMSHFPGGTPFSGGSQIPIGTQFIHGSLDQSSIFSPHDRPLSSPLTFAAPPGHFPPQNAIHMLAQSRLSHHSPQTVMSLSHDHPVVLEWVKAYDLVMKFRDGVVDMLSSDGRFESEVEDLRSTEGAPMEKDQEVQGQVIQMRFSLTLMLHQMEVTLQDSFNKLLVGGGEVGEPGEEGEEGEMELSNLRLAQTQLKKKLMISEDRHKTELQESKETIANLSNKVETLRMEIASLKHSMTTPTANEPGVPLAMFTRLDYDHNTRELQTAVEADQLPPDKYQRVDQEMTDYLTIPSQRLAHITRRHREKVIAEGLVRDVKKVYKESSTIAERVIERIKSREELKQSLFEHKMEDFRVKRESLARDLTTRLGEMERVTHTMLIKPIYGRTRTQPKCQRLITALPRPVPIRPLPPKPLSRSLTGGGVGPQGDGGYQRSMRLVCGLVASRQEARRGDTATADCGVMSYQALSPPQPLIRDAGSSLRQGGGGEREWQVELSRPSTQQQQEEGPFSPLMFSAPPAIPRIMELDVNHRRHVADLLGHLLPETQLRRATTTTQSNPQQHQSRGVQSKLVAHRELRVPSRSLPLPQPPTLPPISVPSRISGPLTAV